jgi:hypothetical protein
VTPPHQGIKGGTESQLFAREAPAYSPHGPFVFLLLREWSGDISPAGATDRRAASGINRRVLGDGIPVRTSP